MAIMEKPENIFHPDFKTSSANEDVLLRSSDGIHFRIPSVIIRTASGFFRSTLGLPQGSSESSLPAQESITIPMPEPASVVETICRILTFHPIDPTTSFPDYKSLTDLLYAAEKYELHSVSSLIRATITAPRFLEDPLRLYSLSCRYNWDAERQEAARRTLDLDFTEKRHEEALRSLDSCKDLLSLLQLRWKRKSKFRDALDSDSFIASKNPAKCIRCNGIYQPIAWREFKWILLNEIERVPSGKTIKTPGYFDKPDIVAVFQTKCLHCNRLCMEKDTVVAQIVNAVDSLPLEM
jgi:hypothetical protein